MYDEDVWLRTVTVVEKDKEPAFKISRPDGTALVPPPRNIGFQPPPKDKKR